MSAMGSFLVEPRASALVLLSKGWAAGKAGRMLPRDHPGKLTVDESPLRAALAANLEAVEGRLRAACARAGRRREDVTLVAVTKTVGVEVAALLPGLGVAD